MKKFDSAGVKKLFRNNIFILLLAIAVICVLLTLNTEYFATRQNMTAIMSSMAVNGIQAIGMTMCLITIGIDLSVGSILSLSGVVLAASLQSGLPVFAALLLTILCGAACGAANGGLIAKGNLPPFIATLGMQSIAGGIALMITNGRPISGATTKIMFLGAGRVFNTIPVSFLIMLACFAIAFYLMTYTRAGRYMYTIGGNREAAKLSGIPVSSYILVPYILSGVLCAIASLIVTGRLNSAEPLAGSGTELDAVAAAIIGGTSMSGGEGKIIGTFLGSLMMAIIKNGMIQMGVGTYPQQVIIGTIIILVVLTDMLNRKRSD